MPTKTSAQRIHAKRRAMQRYGEKFNRRDLLAIVRLIQSGDAELIVKQSNRVSIFSVTYNDKTYKVVYDKKRKNISTFLPQKEKAGEERGGDSVASGPIVYTQWQDGVGDCQKQG